MNVDYRAFQSKFDFQTAIFTLQYSVGLY